MTKPNREFLTGRERRVLLECVRHLAEGSITVPMGDQEPVTQQEAADLLEALGSDDLLLVSTPDEKLFSVPCRLTVRAPTEAVASVRALSFLAEACDTDQDVVMAYTATGSAAG